MQPNPTPLAATVTNARLTMPIRKAIDVLQHQTGHRRSPAIVRPNRGLRASCEGHLMLARCHKQQ